MEERVGSFLKRRFQKDQYDKDIKFALRKFQKLCIRPRIGEQWKSGNFSQLSNLRAHFSFRGAGSGSHVDAYNAQRC